MKTVIHIVFALLLVSPCLGTEFAGGSGTPADPFQIATADQLVTIGSNLDYMDKHFILIADIDLDPNLPGGRIFTDALIARDESGGVNSHGGTSFTGVLDGQGHTIAHLHIEGQQGYDAGLFGKLDGQVRDLNLTDVLVSGSPCGAIAGLNHDGIILRCRVTGNVSGVSSVGAIAGLNYGGIILRCHVTGTVAGFEDVGGLVGSQWDASLVECRAEVQVTGTHNVGGMVGGGPNGTLIRCEVRAEVSGDNRIGGLVGSSHKILESRAMGTVIGSDGVGGLIGDSDTIIWRSSAHCDVVAERTAGGLTGRTFLDSGSLIADCYAQGSVTGSIIGGLAGEARHNPFLNCYAACEMIPVPVNGEKPLVYGLFGDVTIPRWAPITIACFWDMELSQIAIGAGTDREVLDLGTGLTTQEMQDIDTYLKDGWDFNDVWMICDSDYPRLQWEAVDCNTP